MNAIHDHKPLSLRERFFLYRPIVLGNPIVRMLALLVLIGIAVGVALNSKPEVRDPFAPALNAPPLKLDEIPQDFLYNIPRGQLDPTARPDFAEHWGALAHSMTGLRNHAWAGKYVRMGQAPNDALLLGPKGGFAALLTVRDGDKLVPHYLLGTLKDAHGRIDLSADGRDPARVPLPSTLYAVQWGQRHYLLTAAEWQHQADVLTKTSKPDLGGLAAAYIRSGDQTARAGDVFPLPDFND